MRIEFATYGPGADLLEEQGRMPQHAQHKDELSAADCVRRAIERKSGYKATLSYAGNDPQSNKDHYQLNLCRGQSVVAEMWVTIDA